MEFLAGETVEARLGREPLAPADVLTYAGGTLCGIFTQRYNTDLARIVCQLEEEEGDASLIDLAAFFNVILATQ